MRAVKNLLLILVTLTLVAVGALAPCGTAMIQDRRLESSSDRRELSDVQLLIQQELSAAQALNLLGGDYTRVEWNSDTNLTEPEAFEYAIQWAELMADENLIPGIAIGYSVDGTPNWMLEVGYATANPFLVISSEENREVLLLWECTWERPGDAVYTMWIDDATGTMYGINRTVAVSANYVEAIDIKYLNQYMDMWSSFLCRYYGFEIVNEVATKEVSGEGMRDTFSLTLKFKNTEDAGSVCTVQLALQGWNISFLC